MSQTAAYSLAVIVAVPLIIAALLAAWRLIPRPAPPPDLQTLWAEVQANRAAIIDLMDKYETSTSRANARLRRVKAEPVPEPPVLTSKASLRAQARRQYPHLVAGGE